MRTCLAPAIIAALDAQIATHGEVFVCFCSEVSANTLRRARRGHRVNAATAYALTKHIAKTGPAQ
jgi:hypothetical protein